MPLPTCTENAGEPSISFSQGHLFSPVLADRAVNSPHINYFHISFHLPTSRPRGCFMQPPKLLLLQGRNAPNLLLTDPHPGPYQPRELSCLSKTSPPVLFSSQYTLVPCTI